MQKGKDRSDLRFVVVDMTGGGFGNQLLQAIQGLIIAMETGRALILYSLNTREESARAGMKWHPAMVQKFSFDSVLSLIPASKLFELGWPDKASTYEVDLHSGPGLQFVTCSDWNAELAPYRFAKARAQIMLQEHRPSHLCQIFSSTVQSFDAVACFARRSQVWSVTDVHLALLNPHHGPSLRRRLDGGGGLVFLLSRYLWTARDELRAHVHVTSRPPRDWDGVRPLGEVVARIRAARRLVVAVHLRTSPNTPWLHFDHWAGLREDAESGAGADDGAMRYCGGDARSAGTVVPCVERILKEHKVPCTKASLLLCAAQIAFFGEMRTAIFDAWQWGTGERAVTDESGGEARADRTCACARVTRTHARTER